MRRSPTTRTQSRSSIRTAPLKPQRAQQRGERQVLRQRLVGAASGPELVRALADP